MVFTNLGSPCSYNLSVMVEVGLMVDDTTNNNKNLRFGSATNHGPAGLISESTGKATDGYPIVIKDLDLSPIPGDR